MKLKFLFILPFVTLFAIVAKAQDNNPYKSIGKKGKVLTLSKGKYDEFFDTKNVQRIGTVLFDIRTKKIVKLLNADSIHKKASDNSSASRWYSIDPLAEKFASSSPYVAMANNPILFTDPDGQEVWISYGDNQRAQYRDGKLYDDKDKEVSTDDKFANAVVKYLGMMNETDGGKTVVDDLVSSENVYTYTNEVVKNGKGEAIDAVGFVANKDNKGGTIKAGFIMSDKLEAKKLDAFSHDTFHGYQQNNGENKDDVGREVGAELFAQAVLHDVYGKDVSWSLGALNKTGQQTKKGGEFVASFQKALYSPTFDQAAYNQAVKTFKSGSSMNMSGTYSDLSTKSKNTVNALVRFYPLVKTN
jgi:hypothetical protein